MTYLGGALPPDYLLCVAGRPAPWPTDSLTRGSAFTASPVALVKRVLGSPLSCAKLPKLDHPPFAAVSTSATC